ncbi:hypothetical protein BC936DRAFT_148863 [Jimgerdemannia flammicorona]|uniref:Uncharacterized protein n=1 Tax=Jimgerdemannia flammicorona TaxID=994334 RepID=A0A433D250_9FUNG|nr:hypothetical protein BC936DRAFT_148863 [Jimgerdemannia flammicorona]
MAPCDHGQVAKIVGIHKVGCWEIQTDPDLKLRHLYPVAMPSPAGKLARRRVATHYQYNLPNTTRTEKDPEFGLSSDRLTSMCPDMNGCK